MVGYLLSLLNLDSISDIKFCIVPLDLLEFEEVVLPELLVPDIALSNVDVREVIKALTSPPFWIKLKPKPSTVTIKQNIISFNNLCIK